MCVCEQVYVITICEWKSCYQLVSPSHHPGSVSPSFAGVGDIYIRNYRLSRERGRERERGIVWSDLLCRHVLKLLMQSNSLFWIVLWLEYCHFWEQNSSFPFHSSTPTEPLCDIRCKVFFFFPVESCLPPTVVNFPTSSETFWWKNSVSEKVVVLLKFLSLVLSSFRTSYIFKWVELSPLPFISFCML